MSISDDIVTKLLAYKAASVQRTDASRGPVQWTRAYVGDRARVPNFKPIEDEFQPVLAADFQGRLTLPRASDPFNNKITAPASIPIDSSTKIGCKLTESLHTL